MTAMQLVVLDSAGALSRNISLGSKPIAIGRHPDNDVHIEDDMASRFHCTLEPDSKGAWRLRDLGSRNGTRLNDQRVTDSPVNPGDRIRVGKHVFVIEGVSADQRNRRERDANQETGAGVAPSPAPQPKKPARPGGRSPAWAAEL